MVCNRCGKENDPESRYCSACGLFLAGNATQDTVDSSASSAPLIPRATPRQYSREDIEELLIVRKATRREDPSSKVLKQDDVDKLFG